MTGVLLQDITGQNRMEQDIPGEDGPGRMDLPGESIAERVNGHR